MSAWFAFVKSRQKFWRTFKILSSSIVLWFRSFEGVDKEIRQPLRAYWKLVFRNWVENLIGPCWRSVKIDFFGDWVELVGFRVLKLFAREIELDSKYLWDSLIYYYCYYYCYLILFEYFVVFGWRCKYSTKKGGEEVLFLLRRRVVMALKLSLSRFCPFTSNQESFVLY